MKKIIFLTGTLSAGGAERVMSILANIFSTNYQIEIICIKSSESFYDLSQEIKVIILPEKVKSNNIFLKSIWFRKYISKQPKAIVITFMAQVYFFTIISLIGLKNSIITSERIDPRHSKFIFKLFRKILYPFANKIIVQTNDIKSYFSPKLQKKISVIYNPISSKFINGSALNAPKKNQIITIGRLTHQKNHILLIKAFKSVSKMFPDFRLKIYGAGPQRNFLENYIKQNNLQQKVELSGLTDNVVKILNESNLFVLCSDYEGMSNALIEAMYVGLPVISTRISGSNDLIQDRYNGLLIDINNQQQLEKAILEIILNNEQSERMGRNASLVKRKVDKHIVIKRWNELLEIF